MITLAMAKYKTEYFQSVSLCSTDLTLIDCHLQPCNCPWIPTL